jgi:tetratricopeptide (TPR) repeat protein
MNFIEKKGDRYALKEGFETATIPSTIHDVIMARVDSLPQVAKELAQVGSAIEREFDYALIRKVVETPEEQLLSNLSVLKETELMYERGIYPDSVYIFKHALTREVIYDSILSGRQKRIHGKIGDAIAELNKEKIDEYYGVLAEHYIASENYEKAAEYSVLAAGAAESVGSLNDAIAYSKKAVECLEKLPETEKTTVKIVDARTSLGLYLLRLAFYKEARAAIAPVVEKAEKIEYKSVFPKIYSILGTYEYNVKENVAEGFAYLEDAVKTARKLNDKTSLSISSFRLGLSCTQMCQFEKGIDCFERVFHIMKTDNILWAMSTARSYQSIFCYCFWGRIDQAENCAEEAIRIAEESGDIYSKCIANTAVGWACLKKGDLERAEKSLLVAIDFCEKIHFDIFNAVARFSIAETYYELGRHKKSMEHFAKGADLIKPCGGFRSWSDTLKIGLAMAKVRMGDKNVDLDVLCKYSRENRLRLYEGWKLRYIGDILLNIDNDHLFEAEEWIKGAVVADKKNDMKMDLGQDYRLYSDLLKRKGDKLQARKKLLKAIEIFKECGSIPRAQQVKKELSYI